MYDFGNLNILSQILIEQFCRLSTFLSCCFNWVNYIIYLRTIPACVENLWQLPVIHAKWNTSCTIPNSRCYTRLSSLLMIFAGTPATTQLSGTSLETTAPAATIALFPMVTPGSMVQLPPTPLLIFHVLSYYFHPIILKFY